MMAGVPERATGYTWRTRNRSRGSGTPGVSGAAMSERAFRLIQGSWLLAALYFNSPLAIGALLLLLAFEGITNWRVPMAISRLRYGAPAGMGALIAGSAGRFEAERALRLVILVLLVISLYLLPQPLWWLPWLIAFALISAAFSGICVMVVALRQAGLR